MQSLERVMYDAGYGVFEQISPPYLPDRGFFVARALGSQFDGDIDAIVQRWNAETKPHSEPKDDALLTLSPEPMVGVRASSRTFLDAAWRSAQARLRTQRTRLQRG